MISPFAIGYRWSNISGARQDISEEEMCALEDEIRRRVRLPVLRMDEMIYTVTKKSWAKLELKRIKQSLTDYLSSSPTGCWPTSIENWKEDEWDHRVYGILDCFKRK